MRRFSSLLFFFSFFILSPLIISIIFPLFSFSTASSKSSNNRNDIAVVEWSIAWQMIGECVDESRWTQTETSGVDGRSRVLLSLDRLSFRDHLALMSPQGETKGKRSSCDRIGATRVYKTRTKYEFYIFSCHFENHRFRSSTYRKSFVSLLSPLFISFYFNETQKGGTERSGGSFRLFSFSLQPVSLSQFLNCERRKGG